MLAAPLKRLGLLFALAAPVFAGSLAAKLSPTSRFTLEELDGTQLTPKQFANLFEYFRFSASAFVIPVEEFLSEQSGDCDDYAILADHVLSHKGYHTRIVRINFVGSDFAHAICYVDDNKGYLDYNNRRYSLNVERCGPTLRQIAANVADSIGKNWTSATEYSFSYDDYRKVTRYTVVKTDPASRDPDRQGGAR
jgi:hypothetical protein